MAISIQCERCGRRLKTSDKNVGRNGQCPTCGKTLEIPASPIFEEELPPRRVAMEITEWLDPPEEPEPDPPDEDELPDDPLDAEDVCWVVPESDCVLPEAL